MEMEMDRTVTTPTAGHDRTVKIPTVGHDSTVTREREKARRAHGLANIIGFSNAPARRVILKAALTANSSF